MSCVSLYRFDHVGNQIIATLELDILELDIDVRRCRVRLFSEFYELVIIDQFHL